MAKQALSSFLSDKYVTEFEFAKVEMEIAEREGTKIALLYLKTPRHVLGSQFVTDPVTLERVRIELDDVTVIRVSEENMKLAGEDIQVNEDGSGVVKTNLRLDVAQRGDVWLTKESFSAYGIKQRNQRGLERKSGLFDRITAVKTKSTFGGALAGQLAKVLDEPKPQSVASEPKTETVKAVK